MGGKLHPVYTSSTQPNQSTQMCVSIRKMKSELECTTYVFYIEPTNNAGTQEELKSGEDVSSEAQSSVLASTIISVFILQRIILPSKALEG